MSTGIFKNGREMPSSEVLAELVHKDEYIQRQKKIIDALQSGDTATAEELSLELGSSLYEAKAIHARVERLTGHGLEVVDEK